MSGFKRDSRNLDVDPDALFDAVVNVLRSFADWRISQVDHEKMEAVALTPMRILRDLGHVVRVKVEPAKGKFNQGLTTVTVRSNPRWGSELLASLLPFMRFYGVLYVADRR